MMYFSNKFYNSVLCWGLIALLALSFSSTDAKAQAKEIYPLTYTASYALHWRGLRVGSSTHRIRKTADNHYIAESVSSPLLEFLPFADTERSEFQIQNEHVQPLKYTFNTRDHRSKMAGMLKFDWQNQKIQSNIQGKLQNSALPQNAHDKLSQFFQLRKDLALGKTNLEYVIVDPKKTKTYHFKILGRQNLRTSLGTLKTLVLEHISEDKTRRTQLWLASDFDYLMVKLIQIRKDKPAMEATIQSLKL